MAHLIFTNVPGSWHGVDLPKNTLTKVSWDTDPDITIAFVFFGHPNMDVDGSPTAYGPYEVPIVTDNVSDAGNTSQGYFGLIAMRKDDPLVLNKTVVLDTTAPEYRNTFPVVQQAGDPKPGFYVSSLPQASGPIYLQRSYIDSSQFAIGALSDNLGSLGVGLGDYGLAIRHDKNLQSGFYLVDTGHGGGLGEVSSKVGDNLGGGWVGQSYNNNFPVSFIIFPASCTVDKDKLPAIPDADLQTAIQPLLAKLASADNAADLVLLMGFNEVNFPSGPPQGLAKLSAYQGTPTNPKPRHAGTILQGLQAFGYAATIAMADDLDGDDGSTGDVVAVADPSTHESASTSDGPELPARGLDEPSVATPPPVEEPVG
jgi:hypothetical protein